MEWLFAILLPLAPFAVLWVVLRHGPVPNPWWRGENLLGFALFVGAIAFAAGFFGPMVLPGGGNQGPLLGILITGPLGLLVGLVWGALRARQRASEPLP